MREKEIIENLESMGYKKTKTFKIDNYKIVRYTLIHDKHEVFNQDLIYYDNKVEHMNLIVESQT